MMSRIDRHNWLFLLVSVLTVGVALLTSSCLWGIVTDATTGAPISGASVSYTDANGHIGWTTTNSKGLYAFDLASGPIPAAGPITLDVSASGYDFLSVPRLADYKDNPKATGANLSSFWDVQSCSLTPSAAPAVTADLAVTDLYPDAQPSGTLWARITNNGPDALAGSSLQLWCDATRHSTSICDKTNLGPLTVTGIFSLNPGQTENVNVLMGLDTASYWYEATCTVQTLQASFSDPSPVNDTYTEAIPPANGDLELQDILLGVSNEVGVRMWASGSAANQFSWTVSIGANEYGFVSMIGVGSQVIWTGYYVTGTESVSASMTPCSGPETNPWNNQLVKTCGSASHTCW